MKIKILAIFTLLIFNFAFTQKKNDSTKKASVEAVVGIDPTYSKIKEIQPDKIYESVDVVAEFPGGHDAFRQQFSKLFKTSNVKQSGTLKTEITFIIDQKGKITDIKSRGYSSDLNKEAIRAIKQITTLWNPAKINNIPVRYLFRLPVTVQL